MEKPHKKLDVWKLGVEVVVLLYEETGRFPAEHRYGLTAQLRRASVSVVSNIAEGAARQTRREFVHFLHMAQGSASEIDTQLAVARRLGLIGDVAWNRLDTLLQRIDKMLSGLIRQQKASLPPTCKEDPAPYQPRLAPSRPHA